MLFQFFYRLGHKTRVIDAHGDSNRRGLNQRHFQAMAMDDLEDLAQALFKHEGEVFGAHGDKDLVLAPYIYRHVDGSYAVRRYLRSCRSGIAERFDEERYLFVLQRTDGLGVNDLRAGIAEFDGVLIAQ